MLDIQSLKFGRDGLIPAIVQDYYTKQVLTLAYMNRESLIISLEEGYTCFWSRSRQQLWRKGETSGNRQRIMRMTADCDRDALVIEVNKTGPACHTGTESCFTGNIYTAEDAREFSLTGLYALIKDRKTTMQEGSYTTYLFRKGLDKILKKVGEESTEVIIAAKNNNNKELVYELADLVYHGLVLMVKQEVPVSDVARELADRHVIDHKVKQEKMV